MRRLVFGNAKVRRLLCGKVGGPGAAELAGGVQTRGP